MKKAEYNRMAEYETSYWWHLGRLRIIENYIRLASNQKTNNRILNVGCGTGGTVAMLEKFGVVDNVDTSDEAIKFMKSLGYSRVAKINGITLPHKDGTYNLVGAFDVLEHIDDDLGALLEWSRVLRKDGKIIITVPAYQWLWSGHDVSLHHKRRYTSNTLSRTAKKAGLKVDKISYAIAFSLPLVVGFRVINKLIPQKNNTETSYVNLPASINKLFTNLLYIEAKLHSKFSIPLGTSVIVILSKSQ